MHFLFNSDTLWVTPRSYSEIHVPDRIGWESSSDSLSPARSFPPSQQQHLCLQYDMPVYNGLRRLARHLPGDSGEITGRDTKLVRIERDLFLVEIMGMDAIDELMEQLLPHGCTHFAGGSRRSTLSYHTY